MIDFVHLHTHTEYSLLDGSINIVKLLNKVNSLNMKSIAITDHGNLHGIIYFYEQAINMGIKPIIGEEFYLSPDDGNIQTDNKRIKPKNYHIVLLARNEKGLKNLYKLSSLAYIEGFYYKPRIFKKHLEMYNEGLIALSACRSGEVQKNIIENDFNAALNSAKYYIDIFGKENFFLELMRIGLKEDKKIIEEQLEIAKKLNIDYVATNDVHYLNKQDHLIHEILLCIQTGKTLNDENRMRFHSQEFYLKSKEEMNELFKDLPLALENTQKIADMCNISINISGRDIKMPTVEIEPEFKNENEYLEYLAGIGLKEKFGTNPSKEIKERFDYELNVIKKMEYSGYFIILYNLIKLAKENNITIGPGRGSATGSLILFLLDITKVNPLKFGLFFERFLNPDRISMPDVDIDVADKDREKLIKLLVEKYNINNVALIATFGTLKSRQVFTDVARVYEISPSEVKKITKKMIPPNLSLENIYKESQEFASIIDSKPIYKKIFDISLSLENNVRHVSKHAAGVVITPGPVVEFSPVFTSKNAGVNITQFDKNAIEKIGLIKMDLLGLRTLSVIDTIIRILSLKGVHIDLYNIPFDDKETFKMLKKGNTAGVFQLESSGIKNFLRRYAPDNFEDIIKIISFYRPGPLSQIDTIINRRHKKETFEYEHEKLKEILSETYGIFVYQEQVMSVANKLAGFSYAKADFLRKAMSKKDINLMNQYKKEFIDGVIANGISRDIAESIFKQIEKFAEYGFNKSHGTAYAFLSYQTAYLKTHYPIEFMAATINSYMGTIKKIVEYIEETKAMDILILKPDINKSVFDVIPEDNGLRLGLGIIKNVGKNAVNNIIDSRKKGEYKNFYDFLLRINPRIVTKQTIESLIKAGTFDTLGIKRSLLFENLPILMDKAERKRQEIEKGVFSLFNEEEVDNWKNVLQSEKEWDKEQILNYEFEVLEFFISGHPLEKYKNLYKSIVTHSLEQLNESEGDEKVIIMGIINNIKKQKSRKGKHYCEFRLFTLEGYVNCTIFEDTLTKYNDYIVKDKSVVIWGYTSRNEEQTSIKIIGDKILPIEEMNEHIEGINILMKTEDLTEEIINELRNIIEHNPGNKSLYFTINDKGHKIKIKSKKYFLSIARHVIDEIKQIVGDNNIRYILK